MYIGIIGGCGHVGLPLSLILAKKFKVTIIDPSKNKNLVKKSRTPFKDEGIEKYLKNKVVQSNLNYEDSIDSSKEKFDIIIITLGTPVDEWSNPVADELIKISLNCKNRLKKSGILILRSTVTPGLNKKISKLLKGFHIFYCPERIVQGKSFIEMFEIPQIISYEKRNLQALSKVKKLFYFSPSFLESTFLEAELIKLFNNFYRYCSFSISNQMYLISEHYGVSYSNILKLMKKNYPRASDVPSAGLAAGPCLYKDAQQLASFFPGNFAIGNAALQINERLADYICLKALQMSKNKQIIILGAAFKANCDDFRSSLSFKILKNLQRNSDKKVILYDPYVDHPKVKKVYNLKIKDSFFILATPHKIFYKILNKIDKKSIVNVWDE